MTKCNIIRSYKKFYKYPYVYPGMDNRYYWLKGGIILLILSIIIIGYLLSTSELCVDPGENSDLSNPIFGCKTELERFFIKPRLSDILSISAILVISFLAGAVIGFIYGRIRGRNKLIQEKKYYWLKGGIILLIIGSLIFLLDGFTTPTCKLGADCPRTFLNYVNTFLIFPIIPLVEKVTSIEDSWLILIIPIYFFILGTVLGLIYGLIRSKAIER